MESDTDLWEEVYSSPTPNDFFIGFLSPAMEEESRRYWEAEIARHEAAEAEIETILSDLDDEEDTEDGWDGLVNLGNGIMG